MKSNKFLITLALLSSIGLSSCNFGATPAPTQDIGAIQTEAFNLVLTQIAAQQTQTAAAMPPTPIPPTETDTVAAAPTFAAVGGGAQPTATNDPFATATPFSFNTQQPGFTPLAIATNTPGILPTIVTQNGCNDGTYIGETAPFDGKQMKPRETFKKGWTLLNTGTCTWDEGYAFVYMAQYSTTGFSGPDIIIKKDPIEHTAPQHSQSFLVDLKAPGAPGEYTIAYKLRSDGGEFFGSLVFLKIVVVK